jgi:predicted unusual protein kinase regulating ubiquinone biosynthesis (AarF/ABC1/UbiB family)
MKLGTRIVRTVKVVHASTRLWAMYKLPEWGRRLRGLPKATDAQLLPTHERAAQILLDLALDMRGVLIKLCQAVATRSDVFPPAFVERLKQCHDAVPAKPFPVVRAAVERELGRPIEQVFSHFEETPIASASLAQVHRARLADGREVAVKVQYPDIEDIVRTDLANMRRVCRVYEFFDPQPIELLPLLTELTTHLSFELDFRREADSGERVKQLFADDPLVKIPEVHREWSSERVLTMELVSGMKITDKDGLIAAGIDPRDVVQDLMHVYVRMILGAGFFQADPHPGNLMVTEKRELIVLDFGLSKELPDGFGLAMFELMFSLMTLNEAAMIRAFTALGFRTRTGDSATFLTIARRMIARGDRSRFEGEFTDDMTDEMFEAVREDPLVGIPSDFVLVARVFAFLSGIAHTLGGRANVLQAMGGAPA